MLLSGMAEEEEEEEREEAAGVLMGRGRACACEWGRRGVMWWGGKKRLLWDCETIREREVEEEEGEGSMLLLLVEEEEDEAVMVVLLSDRRRGQSAVGSMIVVVVVLGGWLSLVGSVRQSAPADRRSLHSSRQRAAFSVQCPALQRSRSSSKRCTTRSADRVTHSRLIPVNLFPAVVVVVCDVDICL